jgi:predicted ATPase/DNA-binding winged helix-turn-helix (wHTH) protein
MERTAYLFGPFTLVPKRQALLDKGKPVRAGARSLDILHRLVSSPGEVVSKRELMSFAWPNIFVDEANLKVHVSNLRKLLGDTLPDATYIATVPGRGYRFVADVRRAVEPALPSTDSLPAPDTLPERPIVIGRDQELAIISDRLAHERFVTLVGPGGVGKTTLAVETGHLLRDGFADGVCFIDASSTTDGALLPNMLAQAMGLRELAEDPLARIIGDLASRATLIILDNCEHVLLGAALLASKIAAAGESGAVLVTSREPLGFAGESTVRIEPFACPEEEDLSDLAAAMRHPSIALFALRAVEAADYRLSDHDAPVVARICEALDGLPLALELAAANLVGQSPNALLASLREQSGLLHNAGRTRSRHVTLWSTFDWSYRLLGGVEAALFRLLSVFAGSFTLADVATLASLVPLDAHQTSVALGQLISKSLVVAQVADQEIHYRLLDSARSYAAGRLSDDPLYEPAQHRHAERMLAILLEAEQDWSWRDTRSWRERYDLRAADIRRALEWCLQPRNAPDLGVDIATAAIRLWNERSAIDEQLFWTDKALAMGAERSAAPERLARLAAGRAWSLVLAGRLDERTEKAWQTAMGAAQQTGELTPKLAAMFGHAVFLIYCGRNTASIAQLALFTDTAVAEGDPSAAYDADRLAAMARINLGEAVSMHRALQRQLDEIDRTPPSRVSRYHEERQASVQVNLAFAMWLLGEKEAANELFDRTLALNGAVKQLMGQSNTLALYVLPLAALAGDRSRLAEHVTLLRSNVERENISIWREVASFHVAYLSHLEGAPHACSGMAVAIDRMLRQGLRIRTALYMALHAGALADIGDKVGSEGRIAEAFDQAAACEEPWIYPALVQINRRLLGQCDGDGKESAAMRRPASQNIAAAAVPAAASR